MRIHDRNLLRNTTVGHIGWMSVIAIVRDVGVGRSVAVLVDAVRWGIHGRSRPWVSWHDLLRHLHLLVLVWLGHRGIVRRFGGAIVCIGAHTSEFEPDTCSARPAVRCRRITLDFSPSTSLASPHNWTIVS